MDAIIGTTGKKVSKREYEIIEDRDVYIPMSDGIKLNVDIFCPKGTGKYPAGLAGLDRPQQCTGSQLFQSGVGRN